MSVSLIGFVTGLTLIVAIGAQNAFVLRQGIAAGAVTASFVWFFALGYGARKLGPFFSRPRAWQVLDGLIAAVMFALAARLMVA